MLCLMQIEHEIFDIARIYIDYYKVTQYQNETMKEYYSVIKFLGQKSPASGI